MLNVFVYLLKLVQMGAHARWKNHGHQHILQQKVEGYMRYGHCIMQKYLLIGKTSMATHQKELLKYTGNMNVYDT
jgi:hypothetical protein